MLHFGKTRAFGRHFSGRAVALNGAAFTLVEVVLALGVFVFAIMAIVGLVPVSLQTARESIKITRQSAILEHVNSDLQRKGFSSLSSLTTLSWMFDSDGNPLSTSQDESRIFYKVKGIIHPGTMLPGGTAVSSSLLTVTLELVSPDGLLNTSLTVANTGD